MENYILKIGERYVIEGYILMGIPPMSDKLQDAKLFTYDEAMNLMNMICFDARMIEI